MKRKEGIIAIVLIALMIVIGSFIYFKETKINNKEANDNEVIKDNKESEQNITHDNESGDVLEVVDTSDNTEEKKTEEVTPKQEEQTEVKNNNTTKTEKKNIETTNQNTNTSNNSSTTNNNTSTNSSEPQNQGVNENTVTPTEPTNTTHEWDAWGMTEDEYYNKPMFSWEHVDFNTMNECLSYGDKYEPYLNGEVLYSCDIVTSASGRFLGVMFSTEKLN